MDIFWNCTFQENEMRCCWKYCVGGVAKVKGFKGKYMKPNRS